MIKYHKIASDIKEDILKGDYKPNEQLPFEKELCEKYNASRMTVKKALDLLVAEGLIVKRRGSGWKFYKRYNRRRNSKYNWEKAVFRINKYKLRAWSNK